MDKKDFIEFYQSTVKEDEFEEHYNGSKIIYDFTLKLPSPQPFSWGDLGEKTVFERVSLDFILDGLEQLEVDGVNAYGMKVERVGVMVDGRYVPD